MKTNVGLENENCESVSLKSVHLEGKLEGLLLTMRVKQRYLNDSDDTIEATYTFPAGWGSNLLGLSVELNGKRMQAVALAKKKAEKKYEDAIESGDTPVMLEKSHLGLYTANLGNLKPGEEALIEIEYAQLLSFEKGRVRITVPTVIGQRYGDEVADGHVAPHQTVETDLLLEHPFTATLDIMGQMAKGVITCPSHKVEMSQIEGGGRLQLAKGALMDRDFIVNIEEVKGESFVSASEDDGAYAVIASFYPRLPEQEPTPLRLKILVDCSGSMRGESMEQAQESMHELILRLTDQDVLSYSKFGSEVVHTSNHLQKCSSHYIKNVLAKAVHDTDADMGGTELHQALTSTFKLGLPEDNTQGCDLLLITDGDVWEIERTVKQAAQSNHRIFAIGVGSAPAESLLKDLAEKTGGACDLVAPNESISESVLRMTQRMRSTRSSKISIGWEGEVLWQSELKKQVFSDETIHVHARLKNKPIVAPTLRWTVRGVAHEDTASSIEWNSVDALPRLVAGEKLLNTSDENAAEELALKYQLPSKYTNLILVHVRAKDDKVQGLPKLQKIKQMSAAGWGGLGRVQSKILKTPRASQIFSTTDAMWMSTPSVLRGTAAQRVDRLSKSGMDNFEISSFLRKPEPKTAQSDPSGIDGFSPEKLIEKFNELSLMLNKFSEVADELNALMPEVPVLKAMRDAACSDKKLVTYWACLLSWLSTDVPGCSPLNKHAERLLKSALKKVDQQDVVQIKAEFLATFLDISPTTWGNVVAAAKPTMSSRLKQLFGFKRNDGN